MRERRARGRDGDVGDGFSGTGWSAVGLSGMGGGMRGMRGVDGVRGIDHLGRMVGARAGGVRIRSARGGTDGDDCAAVLKWSRST